MGGKHQNPKTAQEAINSLAKKHRTKVERQPQPPSDGDQKPSKPGDPFGFSY